MTYGKAKHRLMRMLLFQLAQKAQWTQCFVCKQEIQSVDELTVEHKKPWLDVSSELFWDLNNVAFSHASCNKPHRKGGVSLRKVGPEGQNWCCSHQAFLDNKLFHKNSARWNGLAKDCKECRSK